MCVSWAMIKECPNHSPKIYRGRKMSGDCTIFMGRYGPGNTNSEVHLHAGHLSLCALLI